MRMALMLLVLALGTVALAKDPAAPPKTGVSAIDLPEGKYWLELPPKYDPKRPAPVLIFLHGRTADPNADNARPQLDNAFVTQMKQRGYVAMCPVIPKEHRPHWMENGGSLEVLDTMTKDVRKRMSVSYLLLSGFSAGSNYTLCFGAHRKYAAPFAGLLVMAGGGLVDTGAPADIKKRPIWLGCGDQDNYTYDDKSNTTGGARRTAKGLQDAGYDVVYDEFPKVGHVMDAKMVEKALAWVDAHTPTFHVYGALQHAAELESAPGQALLALEAVAAVKAADSWRQRADDQRKALIDAARAQIAAAAGNADPVKAKEELTRLATGYRGTSVEKMVKDALAKGGGAK